MGNVGDRLRDARQRQQLSLDDVEAATKIRKKYLIALEQEDFARLPAAVYTRGFVRSYASFLGLDAETLVDTVAESPSPTRLEPATHLQRPPRAIGSWLLVVIIIAMVGAVGVYLYQQTPALPADDTPAVGFELPTSTPTPSPIPSPTAKVYTDEIEVHVKARENCWLEVLVDSQAVLSRTLLIGDNYTWTAQNSIVMRAGNSGGLEVTVNGEYKGYLGKPGEVLVVEFTKDGQQRLPSMPSSRPPEEAAPSPASTPPPNR